MIKIDEWGKIATTPLRIVVSIALAAFLVLAFTIGIMLRIAWTPADLKVLEMLGLGVLTMMGFDVFQFLSKRLTDNSYVEAKGNAAATVAGATPATTQVNVSSNAPVTQNAE